MVEMETAALSMRSLSAETSSRLMYGEAVAIEAMVKMAIKCLSKSIFNPVRDRDLRKILCDMSKLYSLAWK